MEKERNVEVKHIDFNYLKSWNCKRSISSDLKRHNYKLISFQKLVCIDCKVVLNLTKEDIKNNIFKLNHLELKKRDLEKNVRERHTSDITIYRLYLSSGVVKKLPKHIVRGMTNDLNKRLIKAGELSYVGQTYKKLKDRMNKHLINAFGANPSMFFTQSLKKYGISKDIVKKLFSTEVLQVIPFNSEGTHIKIAKNAEKFWIGFYHSQFKEFGWNIDEGGFSHAWAPGKGHPDYLNNVNMIELRNLMRFGFRKIDTAVYFDVSETTISRRVEDFWGMGYKEIQRKLIQEYLIDLITKGLSDREIAKQFLHGVTNKVILRNLETRSNFKINKYELISYCKDWISDRCNEYWGVGLDIARKLFFIKPLIVSCMKKGLSTSQAVVVLANLGVEHREGNSYSRQGLMNLVRRIWGKTYSEMRDIFLEPAILYCLKNQLSTYEIVKNLGLSVSRKWVDRYIKYHFGFLTVVSAKNFLKTNYIGLIDYDYYIDRDLLRSKL